ncbi:MAG: zinc-dependent alcohol dehydrogenase [Candidatus Aminicenantes bacterium]
MAQASALWFPQANKASILKEELPQPKPGWCWVQTLFSAISPGTERLVFQGKVPRSLHQEMRCPYMGGRFSFPVKYGYSAVGRIIQGPQEKLDQIIHVLHPHQDLLTVRVEDTHPLPAGVPPQRATLASNLETAVNAVWDSGVSLGGKILVVGFGVMGSLTARLLSFMPGVTLEIMDIHPQKRKMAEKMGFLVLPPEKVSQNFDAAFHASGSGQGLQFALDKIGKEGTVIEMSWYGTQRVSLVLGESFHSQRKKILSSQVSNIPPLQQPRWDGKRRKKLVFELLKKAEFDTHITHAVSFSRLPQVYSRLNKQPAQGISYLVKYKQRKNHV